VRYAAGLMPWLSLPEYARTTGTPESTVRAAIRAGKLEAHREARAPGDTRDVWKVWLPEPPEQPQDEPQPPATGTEPSSTPAAPTDAPAAITALVDALAAERDERQRLAEALLAATERAARAEADAVYAARERQRADDLAETLIALRASLSAKEREAAELREQLARRRWWKPSTW
jgi:hypothetical protein